MQDAAFARRRVHARHGDPVQRPRVLLLHFLGQGYDPLRKRFRHAPVEHRLGMGANHLDHVLPVVDLAQQGDTFADKPFCFQQGCRFSLQSDAFFLVESFGNTREQELAQQRVVLVYGFGFSLLERHKIVFAIHPGQNRSRIGFTGQTAGHFCRHLRQVGGIQEEGLRAGIGLLEYLSSQVIEYELRGGQLRHLRDRVAGADLLQRQNQAGRPALGLFIQFGERLA